MPRRLHTFAFLALLLPLLAPASAQTPGDVLWSVPLGYRALMTAPTVGPDGTIYMHADSLWVINPDGAVRWSVSLFGIEVVDVGADGTVYTGSITTVHAYNPDGTLKWSFTEPFGGQGIMAGPNVGPDGNIYVVTDVGGLGAFSLTPEGVLRWNVPGFWDREGRGESRVAFGSDQFYFAESHSVIPECPDATGFLAAVTFDGNLAWCTALTEPPRPVVAPNGNVYVSNADAEFRAYTPQGTLDWFFSLPLINSTIVGPSAGPNSEAYGFQTLDDLWSIDAAGNERWMITLTQGNALHPPAVAADNRALVFGAYSGSPDFVGHVIAADPADGTLLWTTVLPSGEYVTGPATFSPDGEVVYVPVSNFSASRLLAMKVHPGTPVPDPDTYTLTVTPISPPIVIGPDGGQFEYLLEITNNTDSDLTADYWTLSAGRTRGPFTRTFRAGQTFTRTLRQSVPARLPAGTYTQEVRVGLFPTADDMDSFTWDKTDTATPASLQPSARPAAAGLAAATSEALPQDFTLSQNHPNPFNPSTLIAYALPTSSPVRLTIYNTLGQAVATLVDGFQEAGHHQARFDAAGQPSGVYLYVLQTDGGLLTGRMTLLK